MLPKITVIGSINMDLSICADSLPMLGETVHGRDFKTLPGGKGSNQAIAAARLGAQVHFVGCVGQDTFGNTLCQHLLQEGVSTQHVHAIPDCATGTAVILLHKGDNCIIVDRGANTHLSSAHVLEAEDCIRQSNMVIGQFEAPMGALTSAFSIAKEAGVPTLLNPAPYQPFDEALLQMTDIIIPNEIECGQLTGIDLQTDEDLLLAMEKLRSLGPKEVIVTLGSRGAAYLDGDTLHLLPARQVDAVDTTGAGDSFCGSLAWALGYGFHIREAVHVAICVSSIAVTRRGASSSYPTLYELQQVIASEIQQ